MVTSFSRWLVAESVGAQVLTGVLENPEDDTSLLIAADWLEESGDVTAAEAVREMLRVSSDRSSVITPIPHTDDDGVETETENIEQWMAVYDRVRPLMAGQPGAPYFVDSREYPITIRGPQIRYRYNRGHFEVAHNSPEWQRVSPEQIPDEAARLFILTVAFQRFESIANSSHERNARLFYQHLRPPLFQIFRLTNWVNGPINWNTRIHDSIFNILLRHVGDAEYLFERFPARMYPNDGSERRGIERWIDYFTHNKMCRRERICTRLRGLLSRINP